MGRRIIVVDDNQDAAISLGQVLTLAGHRVQVCFGAEDAYRLAISFQPSVMIIDLAMPAISGCMLAEQIRQHPDLREVCLIALSGYADKIHRQLAEKAGFDHYLVKPVEPNSYEAIFESICNEKQPALASAG
jgi:CheY-like chemotaxis protein